MSSEMPERTPDARAKRGSSSPSAKRSSKAHQHRTMDEREVPGSNCASPTQRRKPHKEICIQILKGYLPSTKRIKEPPAKTQSRSEDKTSQDLTREISLSGHTSKVIRPKRHWIDSTSLKTPQGPTASAPRSPYPGLNRAEPQT